MVDAAREELLERIRSQGFVTRDQQRIISPAGHLQTWLIDLRRVFLHQRSLDTFAKFFWQLYADRPSFQIGSIETAAIPLLAAVLLAAPDNRPGLNAFIIRKERKTTGLGLTIEGSLSDLPIILIDDLINSGASAEKARVALQEHGRTIDELFTALDYRSAAGMRWRKEAGVNVSSLAVLADLRLPLPSSTKPPSQRYRQLWRRDIPGGFPYHIVPKSAPVLSKGLIYRGSDAGIMHAFSATTGEIIWQFQAPGSAATKGIWSTPAIHADRIYFGAYNGNVYCLDAHTGDEIWVQYAADWVGSSPLLLPEHGLLYIGLEYQRPWAQGSLCALDMNTGEKVWENFTLKFQHGSACHWKAGDALIWGSADHEMSALNPKDGRSIWTFKTERSVKLAPAVDEDRNLVAFASFDKHIYLLDVRTGEQLGKWLTGNLCYTTPLFAKGKLFCGSGDKHLYIIDADSHRLIKTNNLGSRVYASPYLIGDRVVVGTNGGRIFEIDVSTLEIMGFLQLPDAITNTVVDSDDGKIIYISTYMNQLYAIERLQS